MKKPLGEVLRVNLKITIAVVLAISVVTAIGAYLMAPLARQQISFICAVVGGAATVYAAYYAGASVRSTLEQKRRHNAFDILQTFLRVDTTSVRILIDQEIRDANMSPKQLYDKILGDHPLLAGVTALLGQFETVSIAVQEEYADEEVLFYALSFLVPWAFFGLRHYIAETRKVDDNPDLYIELEKLAHAWRERKSLLSGRVFAESRNRLLST
jgi:hypothetical protein